MTRKFVPFDERTIKGEFRSLNTDDFLDLTEAMKKFQANAGVGYTIDNYGEVMMIKGKRQGRGIYFSIVEDRFVLLLVYKKETQRMPKHLLETAIARRARYLSEQT